MANLKKSFDNVLLSEAQNKYLQNRKVIDFIEYNQMPKRFRGIFVKYDADHYVLNMPHSEMAIAYNKKDQNKLEKLLLKVQRLLPVIYKTKNEYESNKTLAFVEDSPIAKYVSDEQLNTIYELHDIFIEIAKITSPITVNQSKDSAALEVFAEYQKECQQKDLFVRAQYDAKTLKADLDKTIKDAYDSFEKQKEQLEANYKEHYSELLKKLTNETCVLAK